ncbi:MAG TPA: TOPRIM nucleotidyl transferase/hydrolase domain-containing protein, partial [Gaiellaceae bacterium]|nr:TOPRIM nucleotidyl transferase/hydrolase domain-containing protein [Gaiellaceae bacterium]
FAAALADRDGSAAAPALAFVAGLERWCEAGLSGIVLLVEEPELFLRPQAQRYLHRLLHSFASAGNQVVFSTHSPSFLNVAHLEELAIVGHDPASGTRITQPGPLPADEEFRIVSELDAERSELFLARAALLVEGRTEKLVFPFVFQALGFDADGEAISVIECGGKSNIPVFAQICDAVGVPFVAVHDRDAEPGKEPIAAESRLNALIETVVGAERVIVLEPDFEGATGVLGHKPQGALRRFADVGPDGLPEPLARAARLVLELAGAARA